MPSVPYKLLTQVNPRYDHALHEELEGLYRGGYLIARHAKRYLPRLVGEHDSRWAERCQSAAFIGYLGQIVDYFASSLFKQPVNAVPDEDETPGTFDEAFYECFASDVDLGGASLPEFMRSALTTALVQRKALVAVDFPNIAGDIATRADEDASGAARAYLVTVDPESMIDWEYDEQVRKRAQIPGNGVVEFDVGRFKWCVLHRKTYPRASLLASRSVCVEEFKHWFRADDGSICWQLFRLEWDEQHKPNENTEVPLVEEGRTSFDVIPIVELSLPDGLWIGNKVGPLNKEHWQRRSILNASENRGLVSIPYVKLGTEIGAARAELPAEVQQDPGRGETVQEQLGKKGYMVLGADDDIGFAAPDGKMQASTEERIGKLVDEMFRVTHLMASSVSSTASAVGRSGASKAEDRASTTVVLAAFGAIMRDFVRRVYECVSSGRREQIVWRVHGLDKFDAFDRAEVLDEAIKVDTVAIPSATFKKLYKTELAGRLITAQPPEVTAAIEQEIEQGVKDEIAAKEEAEKAALEAMKDPNAPSEQPQRPGDRLRGGDASGRKRPAARPV